MLYAPAMQLKISLSTCRRQERYYNPGKTIELEEIVHIIAIFPKSNKCFLLLLSILKARTEYDFPMALVNNTFAH